MWWLSFTDADTGKFLGVAVVEAPGFFTAVSQAHLEGCNPGGAVVGYEVPDDVTIPEDCLNRLLTYAELEFRELV